MPFAVVSRENAKWSVNRVIEDVKEGDVVVFVDKSDADHFVEQGRADPISEEEIAAALAAADGEPEPDDGENDGEPDDDAEGEPVAPVVAAPAAKKKRGK